MILPEHEEQLWQARKREEEVRVPTLAEDALEEMSRLIESAYLNEQAIEITVASSRGAQKYIGFVARMDSVRRLLVMQNEQGKEMIPLSKIIGAEEKVVGEMK